VIGHVARGKDAGDVGAAGCINQDSIPRRNPRALDEFDIWFDPDRHDHEIACNPPTIFCNGSLDP